MIDVVMPQLGVRAINASISRADQTVTIVDIVVSDAEVFRIEPALTQEVADAVREAVEHRLGLRASGEASADAVVRGRISRTIPVCRRRCKPVRARRMTRQQIGSPSTSRFGSARGPDAWQRQGLTVTGVPAAASPKAGRWLKL
jgi:hypothetical protein